MEVRILKDEPNELNLELMDADPSLPQLLVERLNKETSVEFAACRVTHPLVANPELLVKTRKGNAKELVMKSLEETKKELDEFRGKFSDLIR